MSNITGNVMPHESTGEPMYEHAGVIAESERDGWLLGLIGEPRGPWPKRCGDVYIVAPDGAQAGIAWESSGPPLLDISGPSPGRWGVFQVLFPIPVMCRNDLVRNFHEVLPLLKARYAAYLRQMPVQEFRFNVIGRLIAIRPAVSGWEAFILGAEGKRRPAEFIVPEFIPAEGLCQYLADLFHENATPANGEVRQIRLGQSS